MARDDAFKEIASMRTNLLHNKQPLTVEMEMWEPPPKALTLVMSENYSSSFTNNSNLEEPRKAILGLYERYRLAIFSPY